MKAHRIKNNDKDTKSKYSTSKYIYANLLFHLIRMIYYLKERTKVLEEDRQ